MLSVDQVRTQSENQYLFSNLEVNFTYFKYILLPLCLTTGSYPSFLIVGLLMAIIYAIVTFFLKNEYQELKNKKILYNVQNIFHVILMVKQYIQIFLIINYKNEDFDPYFVLSVWIIDQLCSFNLMSFESDQFFYYEIKKVPIIIQSFITF